MPLCQWLATFAPFTIWENSPNSENDSVNFMNRENSGLFIISHHWEIISEILQYLWSSWMHDPITFWGDGWIELRNWSWNVILSWNVKWDHAECLNKDRAERENSLTYTAVPDSETCLLTGNILRSYYLTFKMWKYMRGHIHHQVMATICLPVSKDNDMSYMAHLQL